MDNTDRSENGDSGNTLQDILADLATVESSESASSLSGAPSWSFSNHAARPPTTNSSRPSPQPRTSSMNRPSHQQRASSTGHAPSSGPLDNTQSPTPLFSTPSRSIFSSGPATATVSVNTAQASMSPALSSSSSRPLSVLTAPATTSSRKNSARDAPIHNLPHAATSSRRARIHAPEKDIDDPSALPSDEAPMNPTPVTLSKLFAADTNLQTSRPTSYLRSTSTVTPMGPVGNLDALATHLLSRGLMDGRHSDILVHAFGASYKLHRLMLDRIPFFSSALSGPWAESHAKEMTLHPEDVDTNITKTAFELALKRIYGCNLPVEEDQEALSLFATGCWLDMVDLVDSSVESLLRQMHPSKLDQFICLVTSNYYGKAGDRILASAKAVLFREGWEIPYHYWDRIPADIIREIVGGDAFFIPSEWERWYLAVRLLNRRLKGKAIEAGLVAPDGRYLHPKPTSLKFFAVRFDTVYRQDSMLGRGQVAEKDMPWVALYTSPDVAPLLVLLDEGVHYVHLRFEQLQAIRNQKDILGVPVVPEKVISSALWKSMELRQKVVNAQETDQELGISHLVDEHHPEEIDSFGTPTGNPTSGKGKESEHEEVINNEIESDSWDMNGRPRKFWIPTTDSSSVMGGTTEAYTAAALSSVANWSPHMTRLSASLEPSDVQWATDFMANGVETAAGHSRTSSAESTRQPCYSHYPPFRFAAEFPNPRSLKDRKRIYSQTVWYAGSMWNLYIQRQNTTKNQQMGIYLHRAKERDHSGDPQGLLSTSVDDRIGQLEREMLLRKNRRDNRHWRTAVSSSGGEADPEDDTSASGGDGEPTLPSLDTADSTTQRLRRTGDLIGLHKTSSSSVATILAERSPGDYLVDSDDENDDLAQASRKFNVLTMPAYVDARPTVRTYFKIYSPSKAGRMLSVYESAPDRFNFSQSWGWKSSQMILDDGMGGGKDGKLRYMVVIGIV